MAEYYLISQLPSLDAVGDIAPLPITEERFSELCRTFLKERAQAVLDKITLSPPKTSDNTGSALIDSWSESERNLRFALGKIRAEKMKKSFDTENRVIPAEYIKAAEQAAGLDNPMEAEKALNAFRLEILESLRPMDNFSEEFIFYYGLKLKLLGRMRQFDTAAGEAAYRNIYNSIINGERLEAKE